MMSSIVLSVRILLMLLGLAGLAEAQTIKGSRPNIVLVMTDDQGMGDLSCMGNIVVKTPHIDHFYAKATRFTDFQVSPTCAPTRAALMSGRAPFKNGVTHTIMQRERMALSTYTMPQALQSAGYETGIFGKWHLGDEDAYLPGRRGFDEILIHGSGGIGQVALGDFPPNKENVYFDNVLLHNDTIVQTRGFCTDLFFQSALSWIKDQHESGNPYFAYIALNAPHAPLVAPEKYTERFLDLGWDEGTAARYGMIENIDDNFGRLMESLGQWDALNNTLVIFMTDNGATRLNGKLNGKRVKHFNANLKGGKNSPYEGGSHVPAFWYWKGVLGEGGDVDALTAHIDLYPTFCDLTGAKLPDDAQMLDGRSLVPLLKDPKTAWADRELFFHCGRWPTGDQIEFKFQKCAVRTDRWRFVNNSELYDIAADPGERTNVVDSNPEVVGKLRKSYDAWWVSLTPLLVNENLPKVKPDDQPMAIRYHKQLEEKGIPEWSPK
ncbi:Arylsulfatase [Rubripirellula tenax]|uniref:Arylsulfatase n=1 Tax=Rubripirellula tenax TaxID=2528015 RepID=A0A5C6FA23_9BACT|nr:arylsulfatase [Rubripirellula tenax]TWU56439.1 Arylsulfatase [Rubripirellula tenax]